MDKITKFNNDENKKILFLNRKCFSYEIGNINSNHFIFCESIWDDELDQYFGIRNFFIKDKSDIKIDILIPVIN